MASAAGRRRRPETPSRQKPLKPTNPTEQASAAYKGQGKLTPTPSASTQPKKPKPMSPRILIPERSMDSASIEESPGVATPTCPSPTPFSDRPMVNVPSARPTKEHVDTPFPRDDSTEQDLRMWGRRIPMDETTPSTASSTSDHLNEKYFWLPTQSALKSPMETRFPEHYPPPSPAAVTPAPSSLIRIPHKERYAARSPRHPKEQPSPKSVKSGGSSQSERAGRQKEKAPGSNDAGSQQDDAGPPRPSSPKSRNASRTGRPLDRRASEDEHQDISDMIDKLESLVRRPGSAMDSRPNDFDQPRQGNVRSPKSRNASRTGRHAETPQLDRRVGNISRTEYPLAASPSIFLGPAARPHSDMFVKGETLASRGAADPGTVRPCPRAGAQSRNRSSSGAGPSRSHFRSGSTSRASADAVPSNIEPDETRTMVWSELSKIVGEVLDRPQSCGVSRGRQPAVSRATAAGGSVLNRTTRSESRGPQDGPRMGQRFAPQDQRGVAGPANMRTILDPACVNGPPAAYNSDDEIVAEIIFRSQACPTHSQLNSQGQSTPSQAGNSKRPPSLPRGRPSQEAGSSSRLSQRKNITPQTQHPPGQGSRPPVDPHDRRPAAHEHPRGGTSGHGVPAALDIRGRGAGPGGSFPITDGSPATPTPRSFEPTTPKAMRLDTDLGTVLTSSSDPASGGGYPPGDDTADEQLGAGLARRRSAVW